MTTILFLVYISAQEKLEKESGTEDLTKEGSEMSKSEADQGWCDILLQNGPIGITFWSTLEMASNARIGIIVTPASYLLNPNPKSVRFAKHIVVDKSRSQSAGCPNNATSTTLGDTQVWRFGARNANIWRWHMDSCRGHG